jgi:TetR/AcrR family fatty acid metabolism transcriptional regulator
VGEMTKKDQIRIAAIKVIAKEGFFNATTDKIAKEANVAVGTLYNYFSSKEDILDYIFQIECKKRISYYTEIKNSNREWFAKIEEILRFHFQEMIKDPHIAKIILAERINASRSKLISLDSFAKLPMILADILEEGITEGQIRQCDVKIMSLIIFGFIESVMGEFIINRSEQFLHKALKEMCDLLKKGLAK